MLFSDTYLTIGKKAEIIFKERGSKFIAFAYPVTTEFQIKEHLQKLKQEHHTANHHCYAWRLGADKLSYRANDDGEPSNTAGKPILGQIQSYDLTNILIVVVRYFGGTLLGVSGLINAYKSAALEVIKQTEIIEKQVLQSYKVTFDFEEMNSVMKILKDVEAKITSQTYDEKYVITFNVRKNNSLQTEELFYKLYTLKLTYLNTV